MASVLRWSGSRGLISTCDLRDVGYSEDDVVDSVDGAVIYVVSQSARIVYANQR